MKFRHLVALAGFAALFALAPIAAPAQSYGPSGQNVDLPSLPAVPTNGSTTLSTACATPLTPLSCASTSYGIFSLAAGASDYAFQLAAANGGVYQVEGSLDCINFVASNVDVSGGNPSALAYSTTFSAAGIFGGIGGTRSCIAIVATTAPTTGTPYTAYLSSHNSGVVVRAAVPLTTIGTGIGADTAFPGTISSTGTSLGIPPTGTKGVEIDIPPGATIAEYISPTQAASASAAALVAHQFTNPSTATTPYPLQLNIVGTQLVWVTYVATGTAGTYISGVPTYRWI